MDHEALSKNHRLERWVYANAAARTGATGFVPGDVGKIAYQTDNETYWRLTDDSPVTWAAVGGGGGGGTEDYILIEERLPAGTDAGGFTGSLPGAGTYYNRNNLVERIDTGNNVSITSGQIIFISAGTYRFRASLPAYGVDRHKGLLTNADDSIYYAGTSEYSPSANPVVTRSIITGRFTIAGTTDFRLDHVCETTKATDGRGIATNVGVLDVDDNDEIYSIFELWKEA